MWRIKAERKKELKNFKSIRWESVGVKYETLIILQPSLIYKVMEKENS